MPTQRPEIPTFPAVIGAVAVVVVAFLILRWVIGFVLNAVRLGLFVVIVAAVIYGVLWLTAGIGKTNRR